MKALGIFCAIFLYCQVVQSQNPFNIIQKSVKIEYKDNKFLDLTAKIYKFNGTQTALNFTFKLKRELPVTATLSVRGFLWINDDYRMGYFQLEQPIVLILGMDTFDVQDLCLEYTRPAMIWPLQTGVTYRSLGWNPDTSKYPWTMLPGKWKFVLTGLLANKTKFAVANWFVEVVYED